MFDGVGAFSFLASWAHISSGKDESDLIAPNHSRDAILGSIYSPDSCPAAAAASIYEQDHVIAIQDLYGLPVQVIASDDRCWETALSRVDSARGRLELITFCVNKEIVETLKGLAIERGKLFKCSTFDVLCSHVWKVRVLF